MSCVPSRPSFADRVGRLGWFDVDERTWESFKEIFEAAPEFLAKELRKLRVTRATVLLLASRENLVFDCDILKFLAFSLYQACCANLFVQRALGVL